MSKLQCTHKRVSEITLAEWQDIVVLHRGAFNLPDSTIRQELEKRDYVYLYTEKITRRIVGCVGIQWIHCTNSTILYMGNAVVCPEYKRNCLYSKVQLHAVLWSILRYPTRLLYIGALLLTPEAYGYVKHFKKYWPHLNERQPANIHKLMLSMTKKLVGNHYHLHKHSIICDALSKHNNHIIYRSAIKEKYRAITKEFTKLNPKYKNGEQLVVLSSLSFINILLLTGANIIAIVKSIFSIPKAYKI